MAEARETCMQQVFQKSPPRNFEETKEWNCNLTPEDKRKFREMLKCQHDEMVQMDPNFKKEDFFIAMEVYILFLFPMIYMISLIMAEM